MQLMRDDPDAVNSFCALLPSWAPAEGEPVSVAGYPSTHPLGIVEVIERDAAGAATVYRIWMLDDCHITLEAATVSSRLMPVSFL
jgi:hypothetical protein